jgi:hypothetical protein
LLHERGLVKSISAVNDEPSVTDCLGSGRTYSHIKEGTFATAAAAVAMAPVKLGIARLLTSEA